MTDSLGLSAAPLQLTVIVYESAQVQASLQLINQIPFTGDRVAARAQAQLNIRQLTDASGSTANTAFRSVAWGFTRPGLEGGQGGFDTVLHGCIVFLLACFEKGMYRQLPTRSNPFCLLCD